MKLILNQCFSLQTTPAKPDDLKKTDVEFALFLATDVLTNLETRQLTIQFLETAFQQKALTAEKWANHVLQLTRAHDVKMAPSFVLLQLTNPVQVWMYGHCQVVHIHADKTFEILKPDSPNQWVESAHWTELNSSWVLCREDAALIEPIADSLKKALAQTQYPLEVFFYNLNFPLAKKQAVTIVRVEAIVDLDLPNDEPVIREQLTMMATRVRPNTKTLIDNCLREKKVTKDFFGRAIKPDYEALTKALQEDLELKRIEIAVLEQKGHLAKIAALEAELKHNDLKINDLQIEIANLKQQVIANELVQTELEGSKAACAKLASEKEQMEALYLQLTQTYQINQKALLQSNLDLEERKVAINLLETSLQIKNIDNQSFTQKIKIADKAIAEHKTALREATDKITLLETKLSDAKQTIAEQVYALEKQEKIILKLENQLLKTPSKGKTALLETRLQTMLTESAAFQERTNAIITQLEANLNLEKEALSEQKSQYVAERFQILQENDRVIADLRTEWTQKVEKAHEKNVKIYAEKGTIEKLLSETQQSFRQTLDSKDAEISALKDALENLKKNFIKVDMVAVKGGFFTDSEDPKATMMKVHDFQMGKYPVTQALWQQVMDNHPSYFNGDDLPVERVSWEDVQVFIQNLNQLTGKKYRLPTEIEWAFAAQAGQSFLYSGSDFLDEFGWYRRNSGNKTNPVGQLKPNAFGLYDLSGNVWEWCDNWYDATETTRAIRGGGWMNYPQDCRILSRNGYAPTNRSYIVGFRVVL